MVQQVPIPPPGFDALSPDEKIEYVQSLWDRIADQLDASSLPDWHKQTLQERAAAYHASPDDVAPWDEVRERIEITLNELSK